MIRLFLALLLLPLAAACATVPPPAPPFASDRIAVEVHGSGPDVVLIPGLSSSPRVWDSTIAAVPGYRYHIVHVSGFDGRPAGANASGPVLAPVAEEIARYIREARLDHPAIVGHSMGGSWAVLVAGRHPELAGRVMVVDMLPFLGAMFGGPGATPETIRPIAEQIRSGIASSAGEARRRQIEQTIASMVRTESLRPATVAQSLASDPAVSAQGFYDVIVSDLRPEIANIRVPLTVLYVLPAGAPLTAEQIDGFYRVSYAGAPQAVLKRIPDSYHFIMYDQPEVFRRELREFLAR
ncbi:MAG TPA: alpha/beta hydrolase [Allosphingosinicella sp.]|nr:alpha/beta hydrolase [Allosphingosinicella sp.]